MSVVDTYIIVQSHSIVDLLELVNTKMSQGAEPIGGVTDLTKHTKSVGGFQSTVCQAMVVSWEKWGGRDLYDPSYDKLVQELRDEFNSHKLRRSDKLETCFSHYIFTKDPEYLVLADTATTHDVCYLHRIINLAEILKY